MRNALTDQEIQSFHDQGFVMLPGLIDEAQQEILRQDVDALCQDRIDMDRTPYLVEYEQLGLLTSQPEMMSMLGQLMEDKFTMHHIHAVRQDAGCDGVHWHHDYEQIPQCNRSHLMVHVFYYLNGLNGEVGDLLVLPGSQNKICDRNILWSFETNDLPGSLCIDNVPNGTAIIVHSAVFHARRAKPGGEDKSRYFIDISYCQNGVQWPGYHSYKQINEKALNNHCSRDGAYDYLYDSNQFYPRETIESFEEKNVGSLCLQVS